MYDFRFSLKRWVEEKKKCKEDGNEIENFVILTDVRSNWKKVKEREGKKVEKKRESDEMSHSDKNEKVNIERFMNFKKGQRVEGGRTGRE